MYMVRTSRVIAIKRNTQVIYSVIYEYTRKVTGVPLTNECTRFACKRQCFME